MDRWISVHERMPKKRGDYLCWQPDIPPANGWPGLKARRVILDWTGRRFMSSFPITHWTELPEPPTEERANG
jgi:hypothetical protein